MRILSSIINEQRKLQQKKENEDGQLDETRRRGEVQETIQQPSGESIKSRRRRRRNRA